MKYFFDTEFLEDGKTIELISIGIVAEDGRELYLINEEAPWHRIVNDSWLRENVVPSLPIELIEVKTQSERLNKYLVGRREQPELWDTRLGIKDQILEFVDADPQFWAYYSDYDWVVFCQLFGRMIDLPQGFPMYCRDLKQELDRLRINDHRYIKDAQPTDHNALGDAQWVKFAHDYAVYFEKDKGSPCGY